ncbi:unannotated protein [freshwater metagenome]|uniref:Unannotated protein n=1 Tax=freshwater metagenome TaxID=449393 RepID=A0A6J6WRI1_9ZZZZ
MIYRVGLGVLMMVGGVRLWGTSGALPMAAPLLGAGALWTLWTIWSRRSLRRGGVSAGSSRSSSRYDYRRGDAWAQLDRGQDPTLREPAAGEELPNS